MGAEVVILAALTALKRQDDIIHGRRPDQPGGYKHNTRGPAAQGKATAEVLKNKYSEGGTYAIKAHHLMGRKGGEQGRSILTKDRIAAPMAPNRKKLTPT